MRGVTATAGSNPALSATLRPSGFGLRSHPELEGRRVAPEATKERREAVSTRLVDTRSSEGASGGCFNPWLADTQAPKPVGYHRVVRLLS